MPSLIHEALVMLFRNRPTLAGELLALAGGKGVPAFTSVRVEDGNLTQLAPTQFLADLVVTLFSGERVRLGIVVEVQLKRDENKRYSWPVYASTLRAKLRCPVILLVVTPSAAVARWAARPVETGFCRFAPVVLGPDMIPHVTRVEDARRSPELALLSIMAHGKGADGAAIGLAAQVAATEMESPLGILYHDLVAKMLGQAGRKAMERLMDETTYKFQTAFASEGFERALLCSPPGAGPQGR